MKELWIRSPRFRHRTHHFALMKQSDLNSADVWNKTGSCMCWCIESSFYFIKFQRRRNIFIVSRTKLWNLIKLKSRPQWSNPSPSACVLPGRNVKLTTIKLTVISSVHVTLNIVLGLKGFKIWCIEGFKHRQKRTEKLVVAFQLFFSRIFLVKQTFERYVLYRRQCQ